MPYSEESAHGTGASGVLVAGTIGLTRLVGMAPGADLVMASNRDGTSDLKLTKFCRDEGARVILHEYAPWYGYHLDGSSATEAYIDATSAEGVVHVNPAGNLSGSEKLYKNPIPAGGTLEVPIEVPKAGYTFFAFSFLWRDTTRDLGFIVEDPTGFTMEVGGPADVFSDWNGGLTVYSSREDSTRGTARVDFYLFNQAATTKQVPSGTWKVHVVDLADPASEPVTLIGYVADEISGWGKGIYFPEHTSEDHFIGYPGTADHGMPIAAFTGHGYWGGVPGERASYSGRGVRIDGKPILWISAPDDPITSGTRTGVQALHLIYGGTSGASPHVAGSAALLVSQNPTATGDDVKEAIRKGALADEAVLSAGPVPNTDYGHGKLRIYETLFGKAPPGGDAPTLAIEPVTVEEGDTAKLTLSAADADEPAAALTFEVDRDYDGVYEEKLTAPELLVPAAAIGTVVSKVRVTDSTGRSAAALAIAIVVEKGKVQDPDNNESDGGCNAPAAPVPEGAPLTIATGAALLLLASRRRRRAR
ncbi:MAG: S8 family serine peptidase [Polyangiaceae bacterium]